MSVTIASFFASDSTPRRGRQVVRQGSAKPLSAVRFRPAPPKLLVASLFLAALSLLPAPSRAQSNLTGLWDASITLDQAEIPFRFQIAESGGQLQGFFFEGDRKIASTSGQFSNGELVLQYDSLYATLTATLNGDRLAGAYRQNHKNGKTYAFRAHRFQPLPAPANPQPRASQISGDWEMHLIGEDHHPQKDPRATLSWKLYLRQSGAEVTGSILRIDGDTGTLTGSWRGDTLVLSHFAGERPVLFEAQLQPDGTLSIIYNRLNHYVAARTAEAQAKGIPEPPDPTRFTSVADPSAPFHFQFPDSNGQLVSDSDPRFTGNVVLLAIGGTWCPNCRDEAPFLAALYNRYHAQGLEIVGLNFEASGDPAADNPRLAAFIHEFAIPYPVLLAGAVGEVPAKLPRLINFAAYPTTVFLGRDGRVRSVHAGFASSATGPGHSQLDADVRALLEQLLSEAPPSRSFKTTQTPLPGLFPLCLHASLLSTCPTLPKNAPTPSSGSASSFFF